MLFDTAARNAKPKDTPFKRADSRGLYLLIKKAGKYWRLDYRYEGKRRTLALGVYPEVSLKEHGKPAIQPANNLPPGLTQARNAKPPKPRGGEEIPTVLRSSPASGLRSAGAHGRQATPRR